VASAVAQFDRHVVAQGISSLVSCLWPFQEKGVGHASARENVRVKLVLDVVAISLFSPSGSVASSSSSFKAAGESLSGLLGSYAHVHNGI
jgi:hypothetical protein